MNEAWSCAINITRVIPSALLRILPSQAKRSESPLCSLSKSSKITGYPKAATGLTHSEFYWEKEDLGTRITPKFPQSLGPFLSNTNRRKWAEPQECSKIVQGYSPPWSKQSNAGHELTFFLISHQESHQLPMDRANGRAPVSCNSLQGVGPDLVEHFWGQNEPWR